MLSDPRRHPQPDHRRPPVGPGSATVIIDPGTGNGPGPWIDCTWTPALGTTPEAIAGTITAVMNAIRSAPERM